MTETVDFDIDIGPKISGVYPPFDLTPSEASNMSVHAYSDNMALI